MDAGACPTFGGEGSDEDVKLKIKSAAAREVILLTTFMKTPSLEEGRGSATLYHLYANSAITPLSLQCCHIFSHRLLPFSILPPLTALSVPLQRSSFPPSLICSLRCLLFPL